MGFGASNDLRDATPQEPLGVDPKRTNTNEQGRPLPYFAGIAKLGVTWISEPWDVRSKPITKKVGKKKETVGFNYYARAAAIVCHGPVDALDEIRFDDDVVWTGPVSRGVSDSTAITVPDRGTITFYWGTATQPLDASLAASGVTHPAHRRQCYVVVDLFLGANKTSMPNMEFVLRRAPVVPWMASPCLIGLDANPVAVFAELWASEVFGLGLPDTQLDQGLLGAVAGDLATEGMGISPVLTSPTSFNQVLGSLIENIDAFPVIDPATGKIGLRLVRDGAATAAWDEDDFTDPPDVDAGGWESTYNLLTVKFTNREKAWTADGVSFRDRGNFALTGSVRTRSVERPWVTQQAVAWRIAASLGRQAALPVMTGTARVKRTSMAGVQVGDLVTLTHTAAGLSALKVRIAELTVDKPDSPEVAIRWKEDRGWLNAIPTAVAPDDVEPEGEYSAQPLLANVVLELPYGYLREAKPSLIFLPVRGDPLTNGFHAWWERTADSFVQVAGGSSFAMKGTLNAALDAGTLAEASIDITFTGDDWDLEETTLEEATTTQPLQVFIGNEILVGYDAQLIGPKRYTLKVLREWFGTRAETHASGATAHVLQLGLEKPVTWTADLPEGTAMFKEQPYLLAQELDLATCPEIAVTIRKRAQRPAAPTNLRVFEDGAHPTYTTGQDITVNWTPTSELRFGFNVTQNLDCRADATVLQVLRTGGTMKGEIAFAGNAGPMTVPNAQLVALLGAETDFNLRAYYSLAGLRSLNFDEITVRKT